MEIIIFVIAFVAGGLLSGVYIFRRMARLVDKEARKAHNNLELAYAMSQWVAVKQEGKNLSAALEKRGIKTIAIYGMADIGEHFYQEVKDSGIKVAYGIDQKAKDMFAPIPLYTPNEELPPVDAIVVTPLNYYDEIENTLTAHVKYPILSIQDLMFEA